MVHQIILTPSRRKWAGMLLLFVLLSFGSVLATVRGIPQGAIGILLFGVIGLPVSIGRLIPGSDYLKLDANGLTIRSRGSEVTTRWEEVARFGTVMVGGMQYVGYNFSSESTDYGIQRRICARVSGWDAILPDTYGLPAYELVSLLARCRRTFGAEVAAPPCPSDGSPHPTDAT